MKTVKNIFLLFLLLSMPVWAQRTTAPRKTTTAPDTAKSAPEQPVTNNDLTLKTRMEMQGFNMDSTVYIKGERERTEQTLPGLNLIIATIKECDLRRTVQINDSAKVYRVDPFNDSASTSTSASAPKSTAPPPATNKTTRKGGIVTINVTMTDTGERKEMFGYQARHLKVAMSFVSSPDACSKANMKMETDGWYINFRNNFNCGEEYVPRQALERSGRSKPDCVDEWRYNVQGSVKMGYPADVTMTMYQDNGQAFTMRQQIIELSRAKLDQALFEIPAGYREGDPYSMRSVIGAGLNRETLGAYADAARRNSDSGNSAVAGKKAGTIRLGIVHPNGRIGQAEVGTAIRNTLMKYMTAGSSLEVIPVESNSDAVAKQCDFIMSSTLNHTPNKSGGGLGGFMKKAGQLGQIATGNIGGGGNSSTPQSASEASANIKSKDEISFDYQITKADGSSVATNSLKRKSGSDGEDIISPLLSQAAGDVMRAVLKK